MRLHNPLEKILNNEIKVKLLRLLCRTGAEWSGRRIADEIRASPAAAHKALSGLQREGILRLRTIGKSYLYSLEQDNLIVKSLLKPLFKKEEILPVTLANITKRLPVFLRKKIVSLVIFGSVSRKKERPFSDIDLFFVVKEKGDKSLLDEAMERINLKFMKQYGNMLSPYILSEQEFRLGLKKGQPLLKNIMRDQQLVFGKSLTSILYERKKA